PSSARRCASRRRNHLWNRLLPDPLGRRDGRGIRLRYAALARSTNSLRSIVRAGSGADGGVHRTPLAQRLRRSASLVRPIRTVVPVLVIPQLYQISAVTVVSADDARSRDPGAGTVRPPARSIRAADHRSRPGASLLLSASYSLDSRRRRAAGSLPIR